MTGTLNDNLYYETHGFAPGLPANWTNTNPLAVASTEIYTSVDNFGSTQPIGNWTSRYYNGSTWQDFTTFDTTQWRWDQGSAYVSQFNMSPDNTNTWVARRWTAPRAGTIQIRGVLLKYNSGGDGIKAMIAKNNTGIWPSGGGQYSLGANDQVGTFTNVNSLTVAAGDTIDFEVWNSTGNATSDDAAWVPTVAYTS